MATPLTSGETERAKTARSASRVLGAVNRIESDPASATRLTISQITAVLQVPGPSGVAREAKALQAEVRDIDVDDGRVGLSKAPYLPQTSRPQKDPSSAPCAAPGLETAWF